MRKIGGKPCDISVKLLRKSTFGIDPRHVCSHNAVLRALDPTGGGFDLNEDPIPVRAAPDPGFACRAVISRAASMTEQTAVLIPPRRTCMDPEMLYRILVIKKVVSFEDNALDAEELFQYCISRSYHRFSFCFGLDANTIREAVMAFQYLIFYVGERLPTHSYARSLGYPNTSVIPLDIRYSII